MILATGVRYYLIGLTVLVGTGGYLAIAKHEFIATSLILGGTLMLLHGSIEVNKTRAKGGQGGN